MNRTAIANLNANFVKSQQWAANDFPQGLIGANHRAQSGHCPAGKGKPKLQMFARKA
jgi:hypothetical protein